MMVKDNGIEAYLIVRLSKTSTGKSKLIIDKSSEFDIRFI